MERVVRLDPANIPNQRGLMFAYAHIGDVLGNPNLQNLGDTAGAIEAYRRMAAVARSVHSADTADQRAAGDYAIALARVAAAMPGEQLRERVDLLRQSLKLHEGIARVNPGNLSNRADMSNAYALLGDALAASGDHPGAVRADREALALSETLLNAGSGAAVLTR